MSTDDGLWDEVPENLLRFPDPDPGLPLELLDEVLCGRPLGAGIGPQALALAAMVTTLRHPARPDELRGEATAVAAYQREMEIHRQREEGPGPLHMSVGAKIVALALASSLGMGGIAAAAADGSLPAPLQDLAHVLFGAPPTQPDGHDGDDPSGGSAPLPMPTDTSRQSPSPEEPSATLPTDVLTEPTTSEPCTPDLALAEPCEVIVESGPELGVITEPSPTPTPASDGTDANGSEDAQAPSPTAPPVPTATGKPTTPPGKPPKPPGKLLTPPGKSRPSDHVTDTAIVLPDG